MAGTVTWLLDRVAMLALWFTAAGFAIPLWHFTGTRPADTLALAYVTGFVAVWAFRAARRVIRNRRSRPQHQPVPPPPQTAAQIARTARQQARRVYSTAGGQT
jgi:hypothetical protein